jgi:beta-lactamase class A
MRDARVIREIREGLEQAGLRGSILVRDIDSGAEISLDADLVVPATSLAKIPLALAVLNAIDRGKLDGAELRRVTAGVSRTPGIGRFQHEAFIAVDDLVSLALTISDNDAADALLELVPPSDVMDYLDSISIRGIIFRHAFSELADMPLAQLAPTDAFLAHSLAIRGSTPAQGHPVWQLDVTRTNTGTATAWADLLEAVWRERGVRPAVAARLRDHLSGNVFRHRLAPEFSADNAKWSSKTGTVLNLRHEAGVVEHADGSRFAVVALSTSAVPASQQAAAEFALGEAARRMHDALRDPRHS